jgi:hypothetical protein
MFCPKSRMNPLRIAMGKLFALGMSLAIQGVVTRADAEASTVWQIGTFNESSSDLSPVIDPVTGQRRIDYSNPAQDPVYTVGRSDATKEWFAFQPGTANGKAGYRPHPFTILFNLEDQPKGVYKLKLSLLAYSPRLPRLQVDINGHLGWFYQHPKLSYTAGDPWIFYLPHYSTAQIECELPARFLAKGPNRLVLTALDESDQRDDSQPLGFSWPGTSGIIYDAVGLEHDPTIRPSPQDVTATVIPTIFYNSRGHQLVELVHVFVRFNERPRKGRVTLAINQCHLTQSLGSQPRIRRSPLGVRSPGVRRRKKRDPYLAEWASHPVYHEASACQEVDNLCHPQRTP